MFGFKSDDVKCFLECAKCIPKIHGGYVYAVQIEIEQLWVMAERFEEMAELRGSTSNGVAQRRLEKIASHLTVTTLGNDHQLTREICAKVIKRPVNILVLTNLMAGASRDISDTLYVFIAMRVIGSPRCSMHFCILPFLFYSCLSLPVLFEVSQKHTVHKLVDFSGAGYEKHLACADCHHGQLFLVTSGYSIDL